MEHIDNFEFAFAHKDELCSPFRKKVHDPSAPYDAYEKSGDTEEKTKSGVPAGIYRICSDFRLCCQRRTGLPCGLLAATGDFAHDEFHIVAFVVCLTCAKTYQLLAELDKAFG